MMWLRSAVDPPDVRGMDGQADVLVNVRIASKVFVR